MHCPGMLGRQDWATRPEGFVLREGRRMEIRVLGPVEAVVDGRVRTLPGGGERELLALLALSAGRVVPVPTLVDGLWGEALPVNPGNRAAGAGVEAAPGAGRRRCAERVGGDS